QLRINAGLAAKGGNPPPTAELVHSKGEAEKPANSDGKADTGGSETPHLSFEEREKQIAAAREARPIQLYPAQKPRLDYILSGGAAPAKPNSSDKAKPPPEHSQPESFSE